MNVGATQGNAGTEAAPSSRRPREGGRLPAVRQNDGTSPGRFSRDLEPASRQTPGSATPFWLLQIHSGKQGGY